MSGQDVLRERIAQALDEHEPDLDETACPTGYCSCGDKFSSEAALREHRANAVIAALGLGPAVERYGAQESDGTVYGWEPDVETVRHEWRGMPVMRCRFYVTPWERIEEDQ